VEGIGLVVVGVGRLVLIKSALLNIDLELNARASFIGVRPRITTA